MERRLLVACGVLDKGWDFDLRGIGGLGSLWFEAFLQGEK